MARNRLPILLWACGLGLVVVTGCWRVVETVGLTPAEVTQKMLRDLSFFFLHESDVDDLPQGDVQALDGWFNRKMAEDGLLRVDIETELLVRYAPQWVQKDGSISLADAWRRKLVYQCPAEDPRYVARLYSVGPNGVDENGGGDDIDASILAAELPAARQSASSPSPHSRPAE